MKTLIVVVESNEKSKSDFYYIKKAIGCFYPNESKDTRLRPVYSGSKDNLYSPKTKRLIEREIAKSRQKNKNARVLICFFADADKGSTNDLAKDERIEDFASFIGAKVVWFNQTIEEVFVGRVAANKEKTDLAEKFYSSKNAKISETSLREPKPKGRRHTSNMLLVLDELFNVTQEVTK